MARTKKNRNRRNSGKLNAFAKSHCIFLPVVFVVFFVFIVLFIQQNNTVLAKQLKNAESHQSELISVLRSEKANLSIKTNISEIQKSLREHGIAMRQLRHNQKYVTRFDKTKAPNIHNHREVAYLNN